MFSSLGFTKFYKSTGLEHVHTPKNWEDSIVVDL